MMSPNAREIADLPHDVEVLDPVWIPLSDGCRLAARMWLPRGGAERPVPAIIEYVPYRRRDGTIASDTPRHRYFAGHGYASIRIDIRGSGDSDGVLVDEYLKQEQDDAIEAIAWISRQPWCTGAVGMIGYSWGGFSALQAAARRPPELKAIVAVHATDDRYGLDCHYMGGAHLFGNVSWASTMLAYNARPPDPAIVGERWRQMWSERLDRSPPFLIEWLAHPLRDAYWRNGSVCEDYGSIAAAVYAVGGWADPYRNFVLRLMQHLQCPAKALIGPWAHEYPYAARPGPRIGFLQECVRWWDHWLKGVSNGIMDEPRIRAWIQDSVAPASDYEVRPGRWVSANAWPPNRPAKTLHLAETGLKQEPAVRAAALRLRSPLTTGTTWGEWCPYGHPGELPVDQRPDDGRSLCFDTPPLAEPLELFGTPRVTLRVALDRPVGIITARLCSVAADGASTLLTFGPLNLTRREGFERSVDMPIGEAVAVRFRLNDLGERIASGHRLRLALSTSYWPMIWPAPELATMTLFPDGSWIELPVRESGSNDPQVISFPEPEMATSGPVTILRPGRRERQFSEHPATGRTEMLVFREGGAYRLEDTGLRVDSRAEERLSITGADPLSARAEITRSHRYERGSWTVATHTRTLLIGTRNAFELSFEINAFEDERRVFSRSLIKQLPRVGL